MAFHGQVPALDAVVPVGGEGVGGWGGYFQGLKRTSYSFSIKKHFGQCHGTNFVGTVWGWPLPVPM